METAVKVKERPILFSTPMVRAILEGRKTVTRRVIKESFNGCLTNGGPHPCPNEPAVIYPGEQFDGIEDGDGKIIVGWPQVRAYFHCSTLDSEAKCPYGKPGDILWVRETWAKSGNAEMADAAGPGLGPMVGPYYIYKADDEAGHIQGIWKPSIHMPKSACRLKLEIVSIGVERLQDITEEDAIREGCVATSFGTWWQGYFKTSDGNLIHQEAIGDKPPDWMIEPKLEDTSHLDKSAKQNFRMLWISINSLESWDANPWIWRIEFKKVTKD